MLQGKANCIYCSGPLNNYPSYYSFPLYISCDWFHSWNRQEYLLVPVRVYVWASTTVKNFTVQYCCHSRDIKGDQPGRIAQLFETWTILLNKTAFISFLNHWESIWMWTAGNSTITETFVWPKRNNGIFTMAKLQSNSKIYNKPHWSCFLPVGCSTYSSDQNSQVMSSQINSHVTHANTPAHVLVLSQKVDV